MSRYHFDHKSTYGHESQYTVYDREMRAERRIIVNNVTKAARYLIDPIGDDVLAAFNGWRLAKYESDRAHIIGRYGESEAANMSPFVAVTPS